MSAATLNGTFIIPPNPVPYFEPEYVADRWANMKFSDRRAFIESIGPGAAVRQFHLPIVDVALAWRIPGRSIEYKLAYCQWLARD